ncbi:MAG: hypothetical protein H6Q70_3069 [Firmicutes bacterium]|nr:hypothetical protein [Bacillota bacterium]
MSTTNFLQQHQNIKEELDTIEKLMKDLDTSASDTALHINQLAGKLNVHLSAEDKHLYPSLLKGTDTALQTLAQSYIDEMGNLCQIFNTYKLKFNTKNKITDAKTQFTTETLQIIKAIRDRMKKEETDLYAKIK